MIEIRGRVPFFPTEDLEKVRSSVLNIFPGSRMVDHGDHIVFSTDDADELVRIITDHRIRDTAIMIMNASAREDSTRFFISKQAAYAGVVNFTEGGSPLGDIDIQVKQGAFSIIESLKPDD